MSKRKSTKHCCFVLFCGAPRTLLSEQSYKHPLCVFFPEENRLLLPFVRLIHRPDHLKPVHPDICAKGGLRFRSDQFIFYRPAHGFQNLFILYVSVCLLRGRFRLACHVPQHYSQLLPGLRNRKAFGQVILNVAVRQQNAAAHNGRANGQRSDHSTCAAIFRTSTGLFRVRLRIIQNRIAADRSAIVRDRATPEIAGRNGCALFIVQCSGELSDRRAGCLDRSLVGHFAGHCAAICIQDAVIFNGDAEGAVGAAVDQRQGAIVDDLEIAFLCRERFARQIHRDCDPPSGSPRCFPLPVVNSSKP